MATTASNAPAAFGALQTPSFPQHAPYMTDGLVKTEFETTDDQQIPFASSPLNVANTKDQYDSDIVHHSEEFAPAPAPQQSSVDEMMGNLRRRSESTSLYHADLDLYSEAMSTHMAESVKADLESYAAEEPAAVEPQPMQAYAKLQFDDGDFYVNTYAVELGRDQEAMKRERRHKKRAKRRKAMEEEDVQKLTQFGEDTPVQAAAAKMREMRGTAGSNVSESGGIIGVSVYSDSEDEHKHLRRRRKRGLASQDSSHSQSIAPANVLHNPESLGLGDDIFVDDSQPLVAPPMDCPFIPVYRSSDDLKGNGISRKHVRIEYNSEKAHWELHALGRNGAFIDGALVKKGESTRLNHNSHIQIQQISIVFKLPDVAIHDEEAVVESIESESDLEELDSSPDGKVPVREDSGSASEVEEAPRERVKIKLSLSKRGQVLEKKTAKAAKISLKTGKAKEKPASEPPAPQEPEPLVEMEVRPSVEETIPDLKDVKPEVAGVPATPAANLAPGSVLEGLAPEEIPQKRKGPGRPPKNGVMSKRDEAIIKRKKKELQKAGLEVPPLAELLAMARAESGTTTKKPNEEDGEGTGINGTPGESAGPGEGSSKPQTAAEIEAAKARKMAAKSPSPQKPESEYTEEELKKPQKTYVVLIHDALCNSSTGIMDLQQIYDAIQKMYPYYKYRSQTQGWQSSIRHNLIGSEAFEEAGKIGKGRLWKINPNFDIGKEKKRRAPTPPTSDNRPAHLYQQHQQGQYANNAGPQQQQQRYQQYGPSPYGTPYGPPTNALPNGAKPPPSYAQQRSGTYYSPYAAQPQNGQAHQSPYAAPGRPPYTQVPGQAPNAQSSAAGTSPAPNQQRPNGQTPSQGQPGVQQAPMTGTPAPQSQARPPQQQEGIGNNDTIEEIMAYHKRYLGQFRQGPEQDAARDLFRKAVSRHIDQNKVHGAYISEEERKVADVIGEIITRNKNKPRPAVPHQAPSQQSQTPPLQSQIQAQPPPQAQHPPVPASQAPPNGTVQPQPQHNGTPRPAPPPSQAATHPQMYSLSTAQAAAPPAQMSAPTNTVTAPMTTGSSTTIDLTGGPTQASAPATTLSTTAPPPPPSSINSLPGPAAGTQTPATELSATTGPAGSVGNSASEPMTSTPPVAAVASAPDTMESTSITNQKRSADEAADEPDAKRVKN
ncbi:Forkhead domain-containing protein 2 [Elsinoe fawcettii]|nr:Forkhead domain-containing protein 2 [Elsinoe fawcettii]